MSLRELASLARSVPPRLVDEETPAKRSRRAPRENAFEEMYSRIDHGSKRGAKKVALRAPHPKKKKKAAAQQEAEVAVFEGHFDWTDGLTKHRLYGYWGLGECIDDCTTCSFEYECEPDRSAGPSDGVYSGWFEGSERVEEEEPKEEGNKRPSESG